MPVSPAVRRLRGRWPSVVERVSDYAETIPEAGVSLSAFGASALADVDASDVLAVTKALAAKEIVWLRRNRGEVRIFRRRPESIAGLIGGVDPTVACLSDAAAHLCGVTRALAKRERAKADGDFVAAEAARDQCDVGCHRFVEVVRRHVARGLVLEAFRRTLWANWVAGTLDAVAIFEPALARESTACLSAIETRRRKRIPHGLSPQEKVATLVEKAGVEGITKTGLRRSMSPKPNGDELALILDGLTAERRVEVQQGRRGCRYIVSSRSAAACLTP